MHTNILLNRIVGHRAFTDINTKLPGEKIAFSPPLHWHRRHHKIVLSYIRCLYYSFPSFPCSLLSAWLSRNPGGDTREASPSCHPFGHRWPLIGRFGRYTSRSIRPKLFKTHFICSILFHIYSNINNTLPSMLSISLSRVDNSPLLHIPMPIGLKPI